MNNKSEAEFAWYRSPLFRSLCIVLILIIGTTELVPSSYATSYQVAITHGSSSSQNCVTAGNCFYPANIQISVGDTVTWTNQDSVGHTVTSGHPTDTQTGTLFDSGLIRAGYTYSLTFNSAGTYNYFDQVHPWVIGTVIVQNANYNNLPQQESVSVSTDKSSYNYGDVLTMMGNVNLVIPNQMMRLQLESSTDQVEATTQISPNIDGTFSTSAFRMGDPNLPAGIYTIVATYYGVQSQTTFSYSGYQSQSPPSVPQPPPPTTQPPSPPSSPITHSTGIVGSGLLTIADAVRGYAQVRSLSTDPTGSSLQLNNMLNILTTTGVQNFWIQNVIQFSPSINQLRFIDNIWLPTLANFTSCTSLPVMSCNPVHYYWKSTGFFSYSLPLTINLYVSEEVIQGKGVYVNFDYVTSAGLIYKYDQVLINDPNVISASYLTTPIVGTQGLPIVGQLYDSEWVWAGDGGGSTAYFTSMDSTLGLFYRDWTYNTWNTFPHYRTLGYDTAEMASNISSQILSGNDHGYALVK